MRSELERLGVQVRGKPYKVEQLRQMLRDRGYTIDDGKDAPTTKEDR